MAIEQHERARTAIRRRQHADPELEAVQRRLTDLRAQEGAAVGQGRALEADLAEIEDRIKRGQNRMYAGQIVDVRELSSLERELEHLRVRMDELEGRVLASMDHIESLHAAIEVLERDEAERRAQRAEQQPDLARQIHEHDVALTSLHAQRDQLAATLDQRSLDLYTRTRRSAGHAVARVAGNVCGDCRVTLTTRDLQHVHSGEVVICPNCARILYDGK